MRLLRVLLLLVLAVGAFWLLGRTSEEARIRRFVRDLTAAFNAGDVPAFLAGVTADYRDETTGLRRDTLGAVFRLHALRQARHRWLEVTVPEETLAVQVTGDGVAQVALAAIFREPGGEKDLFRLDLEGEVVKREGKWRFRRTRHRWVGRGRPWR